MRVSNWHQDLERRAAEYARVQIERKAAAHLLAEFHSQRPTPPPRVHWFIVPVVLVVLALEGMAAIWLFTKLA
jgi:hypothetical protein